MSQGYEMQAQKRQAPSRQSGELSEEQLLELIAQVEQNGMLRAPVGLKQNILERSQRADVQLIVHTQELSKNMQFFFYTLKIGAAAAMAMFLLFCVPQDYRLPDVSKPPQVEMDWDDGPQKTLAEKVDEQTAKMTEQLSSLWERLSGAQ